MPTRYASFAHRKQTFKRAVARDAEIRREIASWPGGIPPQEPEREVTYAENLLPDAEGYVHGIVQADPNWVVQCDGCGRLAVGASRNAQGRRSNLVILFCGITFGHDDPRRMCARCRVEAGWNDFDTQQCRERRDHLEFYEKQMQEREPALFDEEDR